MAKRMPLALRKSGASEAVEGLLHSRRVAPTMARMRPRRAGRWISWRRRVRRDIGPVSILSLLDYLKMSLSACVHHHQSIMPSLSYP